MVTYQVDDSLQNSSVSTFFCYVLITSSCVFALLILRDFVKKVIVDLPYQKIKSIRHLVLDKLTCHVGQENEGPQ